MSSTPSGGSLEQGFGVVEAVPQVREDEAAIATGKSNSSRLPGNTTSDQLVTSARSPNAIDGIATPSCAPAAAPELPQPRDTSAPAFAWGEIAAGEDALLYLQRAYHEAVHWQPNLFTVPLGSVGKRFVEETTRLTRSFAEQTAHESVSFWALMVMPLLLLQKPADPTSHRQRLECLGRRLESWLAGRFDELLVECRVLQEHLYRRRNRQKPSALDEETSRSRSFARLMFQGKVKAALRLLSANSRGQVLDLNERFPASQSDSESVSVREILNRNTRMLGL